MQSRRDYANFSSNLPYISERHYDPQNDIQYIRVDKIAATYSTHNTEYLVTLLYEYYIQY